MITPIVAIAASISMSLSGATWVGESGLVRHPDHGQCVFLKAEGERRADLACRDGWRTTLRPLRYEDGRRGYWLADVMGNGKGKSFVALRGQTYRIR